MEKQQKNGEKRIITMILFILTVVFAFLALAFKLYDIEMSFLGTSVQSDGNGFSVISEYPELLEEIGAWLGGYSILVIAIVIAEIVVYAVTRKKNAEKMLLIEKILVVTNVILTLIYMINGFNAKQTIEEQSSYYQVTTSAMIPFIIVVVLAAAYFAVTFFVKENFSLSSLKQKTAKTSEMTTADELAKYKNLLDEGAITQDEYDAKKKELLGL